MSIIIYIILLIVDGQTPVPDWVMMLSFLIAVVEFGWYALLIGGAIIVSLVTYLKEK